MKCRKCGADSPNEMWCNSCGQPLNSEAVRVKRLSEEKRRNKKK